MLQEDGGKAGGLGGIGGQNTRSAAPALGSPDKMRCIRNIFFFGEGGGGKK